MRREFQVAYATDTGLVAPTALSVFSALRHSPSIVTVHLLASGLPVPATDLFRRIATDFQADLVVHEITPNMFDRARDKGRHVPRTALSRMLLPSLTRGHVLYIDGDTLVRRDLAPFLQADLQGNFVGGVRDYGVLRRAFRHARGRPWPEKAEVQKVVGLQPVESYINSGIVLMDCDAIRATPGLSEDMQAFDRAAMFTTVDQDFLNLIFRGRILHMNPSLNSSWGRHRAQAGYARWLGVTGEEIAMQAATILHFHGPHKPWRRMTRAMLKRNLLAPLIYRSEMRRFLRRYPDVTFN